VVNLTAERGVTRLENGHGYTQTGQEREGQEQRQKPTADLGTVAKMKRQSVTIFIQHAGRFAFPNLYYRLWPVRPYSIFPHYLINVKIFGSGVGVGEVAEH